ncbi:thermonuclease family protein [Solidesulfovibrio alcoholivorans]|uniref:thermonuclease family protein n=1 Tax=Solidesulfovibrio alcoholivorans TaxID=81406 RepID=UPI00138DFE37|nr:thermonuclease family protein [Solidesulfovibrio alcoholivorans]
MRIFLCRFSLLLCFLSIPFPSFAYTISGKVIHVLDGDTVDILSVGQQFRVRLAEIDAPEISHGRDSGQPFGQKSRITLSSMIAGKTVNIVYTDVDKYGRAIGTIFCDNVNINASQVLYGMAWVCRRYSHSDSLLRLEAEAKSAHRGLWADPNAVAPWTFRHANLRGQINDN